MTLSFAWLTAARMRFVFIAGAVGMLVMAALEVLEGRPGVAWTAGSLTCALAVQILYTYQYRRADWVTTPILVALSAVLTAPEKPIAALFTVGVFVLPMIVIVRVIKQAYEAQDRLTRQLRTKGRVESVWDLNKAAMRASILKSVSPSRRWPLRLATTGMGFASFGPILLFFIISAVYPPFSELLETGSPLSLLTVMLFVYLPAIVGFGSSRLFTALLSAELVERQTIEGELKAARELQMGLLPSSDPEVPGYEISGRCLPASDVGGDFFDYVWLNEAKTTLGIAVADVSGKAMKAAMTAVMTSGMLYNEVQRAGQPREILGAINRPLYLRSDRRTFTAMLFATLTADGTRELTVSCAGQIPPLLIRRGSAERLETPGVHLPLGVQSHTLYSETSKDLEPGDVVVFMTDGITEAANAAGEEYRLERVGEVCVRAEDRSASEIIDAILRDVTAFAGQDTPKDDMTLVVVKVG